MHDDDEAMSPNSFSMVCSGEIEIVQQKIESAWGGKDKTGKGGQVC